MRENSKKKMFSLQTGILRILLMGMIAVLLLMGTLMVITTTAHRNRVHEQSMREVEDSNEALSENIGTLRNAVQAIYSTGSIADNVLTAQTEAERWSRVNNAMNVLKLQMQTGNEIGGLLIYYGDVKPVLYYMDSSISYRDQDVLNNMGKAVDPASFMVNTLVVDGEDDSYFFVSMKKPGAKICGFVRLGAIMEHNADGKEGYGYIQNGELRWLPGTQAPELDVDVSALTPGIHWLGSYTAYVSDGPSSQLALVKVVRESIWRFINWIYIALLIVTVLLIGVSLQIRKFALSELSNPLVDMKETLGQLQGGVWDVDFQVPNRIQEIEDVRQTVNVMLKEIEQYKNRTYEEQMERQRTQLQYCQLQLAPHFYTNCLKNAYYMLMMKEYDSLEQFLLRLSTHLRYLLQQDVEMVPMRVEKEFVENYIALQQLLSQKEIKYEISIDPGAEEIEVPILALQTFVENSVKYAKKGQKENLNILIRIVLLKSEEGDRINISIADNGSGYPGRILEILNTKEPAVHDEVGIGIVNLLQRCRFHYGDSATWGFLNMNGAVSELILPVAREEQP